MKKTRFVTNSAIVKIFAVHSEPNYSLPWSIKSQFQSSSTGFAFQVPSDTEFEGLSEKFPGLIMTNAHSVQNASVVQVRTSVSALKFVAKVLAVAQACDLAILTVEDPEFWKFVQSPLQFEPSMPSLHDTVVVVGFPIGGDNTCVTQGVISRIDVQEYAQSSCSLVAVQIDAAINPGNSGGPAMNGDGKIVGVAFQALKQDDSENIGYIIPSEIALFFLRDFARHGKFTGFGHLGVKWQKMENRDLRKKFGIEIGDKGVVIVKVEKTQPSSSCLKVGDVILAIDQIPVSLDGTINVKGRLPFSYICNNKFPGQSVDLEILRDGRQSMRVTVPLGKQMSLVPRESEFPPKFYSVSGLIFVALTESFLRSEFGEHFSSEAPVDLIHLWQNGSRDCEDHEVVTLVHAMSCEWTVGYEGLKNLVLSKLNSNKIFNLIQLDHEISRLRESEEFLEFEFSDGSLVVLDSKKSIQADTDLKLKNLIPVIKRL
jgi:S1-C subfamily serine protease